MTAGMEVDEVVARFKTGSAEGTAALYARYGRLVFVVALRILGDRGLAEDATQQTFVQAWRHAGDVERGRDPGPWLATIARRVAIDITRRERRRPTVPLSDDSAGDAAITVLPPDAETMWRSWRIREAVDALEPREREVVRLQHQSGLTHVEIAEQLGIAVGTVKSRSFRAHRSLAAALADLRADEPNEPAQRTDGSGGVK
jgi:RNA polymerase sigma factor (sigma-70 family)